MITHERCTVDLVVDDLLKFYYYLRLTRGLEDRVIKLYRQGKVLGGLLCRNRRGSDLRWERVCPGA